MDPSLRGKDKVRKQLGGHHIPDAVRKQWTHYGKWHLCFSFYLPGLCLNDRVFAAVKGLTEVGNVCLWFNLWMSSSFINAFIHHMPFILAQDRPWINSQAQQCSQTLDVLPRQEWGAHSKRLMAGWWALLTRDGMAEVSQSKLHRRAGLGFQLKRISTTREWEVRVIRGSVDAGSCVAMYHVAWGSPVSSLGSHFLIS